MASARKLSVILLAAGSSSRLGQPKQLLAFKGSTLVHERLATIGAILPDGEPPVLVTGANRSEVAKAVKDLSHVEAFNATYSEGMGGSIRAGLEAVPADSEGCLFMLVDQPFVGRQHLREMIDKWQMQPDKVVAAEYSGIAGVPAIFPRRFFSHLSQLAGDQGARKILAALSADDVVEYHLPEAAVDIDTLEDLKNIGL